MITYKAYNSYRANSHLFLSEDQDKLSIDSEICPGIYYNAVQSYLVVSNWTGYPKQCVDFLRVNIEIKCLK